MLMTMKMDNRRLLFLFPIAFTVLFCLLPPMTSGLPVDDGAPSRMEKSEEDEERRATWLETRNLEQNFKELVYLSINELASEGLLNPEIVAKQQVKRGRHQGFCFRKTKSGRFLPYICWKEGEQE